MDIHDRNWGRQAVTLTLSARQVETLAKMCRAKAKKYNARRDMSFVPEPGKRDANVLATRRLITLAKKLEHALPEAPKAGLKP